MQRRSFFKNGSLAFLGTTLLGDSSLWDKRRLNGTINGKTAKNIIFMVSDGMSNGTLNMASLFLQRKYGKQSHWIRLYEEQKAVRALMDTASASSLVTDSAAGSSAWGGGVRVNNGSLNVSADGTLHTPILQKFKKAGKAVGCVTTVPVTHATPAGFSVCSEKRSAQDDIALQYLSLRFDVMMGGGLYYFSAKHRKDQKDVLQQFRSAGYQVALSKNDMLQTVTGKPVLGVFADDALPYALDRTREPEISQNTPSLAEMTTQAINLLKHHPNGFVMQVEAGKVDWAAHANDIGALLYDQIDFDDTIKVVMDFAEADQETLVIITTDHGNANPGLFYGNRADRNFDRIQTFQYTNDWILNGIHKGFTVDQVIERIEHAQGIALSKNDAAELLKHYTMLDESGIYNPRNLPFRFLSQLQSDYTSVGWGSMDHSADYVELAMYGPGSERLKPFVKNYELHNFMLQAAAVQS